MSDEARDDLVNAFSDVELVSAIEAVSYTHLDVYKRQDDKVLHSFHRAFNIQLLFCTPAVERKAAPALSTILSHCIHNPVENHGAAPFHTF